MSKNLMGIAKRFLGMALTLLILLCMNHTAFAGTWKFDGPEKWKWWYQNDDGSYPHDGWAQINGKWYHFAESGYLNIGWFEQNGKSYILEDDGIAIGQMRENKKYRTYSIDENGEVHRYNLKTWNGDSSNPISYEVDEYYYEETGEKYFDICKDLGLVAPANGIDISPTGYWYDESYVFVGFDHWQGFHYDDEHIQYDFQRNDREEDLAFMKEEGIKVPTRYDVITYSMKPNSDMYEYMMLIEERVDAYGQNGDWDPEHFWVGRVSHNSAKALYMLYTLDKGE